MRVKAPVSSYLSSCDDIISGLCMSQLRCNGKSYMRDGACVGGDPPLGQRAAGTEPLTQANHVSTWLKAWAVWGRGTGRQARCRARV
jgi:hypothetical protein